MIKGVLISCINRPPGYSIAKKLKAWDSSLKICGSTVVKPNWLVKRSRFFDSIEYLPLPKLHIASTAAAEEQNYLNRLVEIMRDQRLDAFLPANDEEIYLASKYKSYLQEQGIQALCNEWQVSSFVQNKYLMNQKAHEVGFPAPIALKANASEDELREIGFPLILKAERSTSSAGVRKVDSYEEFAAARQDLANDYDSLFVEEYIQGSKEVSINLVRTRSGKIRCCFGLEKHHYIHSSWSTTIRIIKLEAAVEAAAIRLADSIDLVGFAAIQTKVDAVTGELKLVEVNPRLGNNARILIRMIPQLGSVCVGDSEEEIPVPYTAYGVSLFDDLLTFPLFLYHKLTHRSSGDNETPSVGSMLYSYVDIYRRGPHVDDLTVALFNDTLFFLGFTALVIQLERLPRDWKKLIPWGAVN